MQVYKTKYFNKWAKKTLLTDQHLLEAVDEMMTGLIDANLGGGLFKKRVRTTNKGKRGGLRTLLAFRSNDRAIFLYGFEKNDIENISKQDEYALKEFSKIYLEMSFDDFEHARILNELIEVKRNAK